MMTASSGPASSSPPPPSTPTPPPFRWRARAWSFRHALRGVADLVRTQHNARLHLAATAAVLVAGLALRVDRRDWALLALATAGVWTAEALNTALEFLADAVRPERDPLVGRAKDAGAAGVLLASAGAFVVGLLVFGPPLLEWCARWLPPHHFPPPR